LGKASDAVQAARALARDLKGSPVQYVVDNLLVEMLMAPTWVPDASTRQEWAEHAAQTQVRSDRASVLWGVQAQMALGQWSPAAQRLRSWVVKHPRDALAWQLLAQVQTQQGLRMAAVRAEAESRVSVMDYQGALDRLKVAQQLKGRDSDDWEAVIVQSRLRQVAELLKESQRED
jgi:predicted Zn-dependent protease